MFCAEQVFWVNIKIKLLNFLIVSAFISGDDCHSCVSINTDFASMILGDIIYQFGTKCLLYFLQFVHFLQSSLIWSIISTFYYSAVGLLACDLFYTTLIKPR